MKLEEVTIGMRVYRWVNVLTGNPTDPAAHSRVWIAGTVQAIEGQRISVWWSPYTGIQQECRIEEIEAKLPPRCFFGHMGADGKIREIREVVDPVLALYEEFVKLSLPQQRAFFEQCRDADLVGIIRETMSDTLTRIGELMPPLPQGDPGPEPRWEDAGTRTILQWPLEITYDAAIPRTGWRGFTRKVPRKAYYTVDGGRLCPCKGMTDEDLDDYEHLFKVGLIQPKKTDWGGVLILIVLAFLGALAVFER